MKRKRTTLLYIRDFTPASQGETAYVKKHSGLIRFIEELVTRGSGDTLEVTTQMSLGDNEAEFRESLRRIKEADLYLQIGRSTYHPIDLPMIPWSGK